MWKRSTTSIATVTRVGKLSRNTFVSAILKFWTRPTTHSSKPWPKSPIRRSKEFSFCSTRSLPSYRTPKRRNRSSLWIFLYCSSWGRKVSILRSQNSIRNEREESLMNLKISEHYPDVERPDQDGQPVKLSALVGKFPFILSFYRGYW